jgi:hypothetical protein
MAGSDRPDEDTLAAASAASTYATILSASADGSAEVFADAFGATRLTFAKLTANPQATRD